MIEHRLDTRAASEVARQLLAEEPDNLIQVWRHAILQLLDDYNGARRAGEPAHKLLEPEPPRTGDSRVDAALAALTEHLAHRDEWPPPSWVNCPDRYAQPCWYVAGLRSLEAIAVRQSPKSFRTRGIYITDVGLSRA